MFVDSGGAINVGVTEVNPTLPATPHKGDLLVAFGWFAGGSPNIFSGAGGVTWTTRQSIGAPLFRMWDSYGANQNANGPGVTLQAGAGNPLCLYILHFDRNVLTSAEDVGNTASGTSANIVTGTSASKSQVFEIAVGCIFWQNNTTTNGNTLPLNSILNGYTLITPISVNLTTGSGKFRHTVQFVCAPFYKITNVAGAENSGATLANSPSTVAYNSFIQTYKMIRNPRGIVNFQNPGVF